MVSLKKDNKIVRDNLYVRNTITKEKLDYKEDKNNKISVNVNVSCDKTESVVIIIIAVVIIIMTCIKYLTMLL